MNPNVSDPQRHNQGRVNFKCSDVGPKNCDWQVSGNSEQEIMPKIEQHGREKHGLKIDEETSTKVRNAIRKQAAAAAGSTGRYEQHT
jgi:predicted small metal-binding protein